MPTRANTRIGETAANRDVQLLLIEDDPRLLDVLEKLLAAPDRQILRAMSGEAALRALRANRERDPAVAVIDVTLPGIDGYETAREIRALDHCQAVPIIFLTGTDPEGWARGYGAGAVDFLQKPADPGVLAAKIEVFVTLQKERDRIEQLNEQLAERQREIEVSHREIRQALREAERAREEAESATRADRSKTAFLAAVSHNLRTPLNAIIGFSELLLRHDQDLHPDRRRMLTERVLDNARHELGLVENVLNAASAEEGMVGAEAQVVDVRDFAERTRREFEASRGMDLDLRLASELAAVTVDSYRLQQVVDHFLSNAAKFTPKTGHVALSLSSEEMGLRVEVTDTGPGIDRDDQEKVFQPFHKVHENTPGAGLGLATVKRVVEAQGGRVGVESNPGTGSVFWAWIPCVSVFTSEHSK